MIEIPLTEPHYEDYDVTHAVKLEPEDFEDCRALFCSVLRPPLPTRSEDAEESLTLEPAGDPCEPLAIRYQLPSGEKSPAYTFNPGTLAYECGGDAFLVSSVNEALVHVYVSWSDFLAINSEAARAGLRSIPLETQPELVAADAAGSPQPQVLLALTNPRGLRPEARLVTAYRLSPWAELGHLEVSPGLWDLLWANAKKATISDGAMLWG